MYNCTYTRKYTRKEKNIHDTENIHIHENKKIFTKNIHLSILPRIRILITILFKYT